MEKENFIVNLDFAKDGFQRASMLILQMGESEERINPIGNGEEVQVSEEAKQPHPNPLLELLRPFLLALVEHKKAEVDPGSILTKVHVNYMSFLVQFCTCMLTGEIDISASNVQNLMVAAREAGMEDVATQCYKIQMNRLNPSNCVEIRDSAMTHGFLDLSEQIEIYIRNNYTAIAETTDFLELSPEVLNERIIACSKAATSDQVIFRSIVRWVGHNEEARIPHLPILLKNIKLEELVLEYPDMLNFPVLEKIQDLELLQLFMRLIRISMGKSQNNLSAVNDQPQQLSPSTSYVPIPEDKEDRGKKDSPSECDRQDSVAAAEVIQENQDKGKETTNSPCSLNENENGNKSTSKRGRKIIPTTKAVVKTLTKSRKRLPSKRAAAAATSAADLKSEEDPSNKKKKCQKKMCENLTSDVDADLDKHIHLETEPTICPRGRPRSGRGRRQEEKVSKEENNNGNAEIES